MYYKIFRIGCSRVPHAFLCNRKPRVAEKLALQYYTKLQSCPSNPAFECTIDPKYKELFARKESPIPSFGIRIRSLLDASSILTDNVDATVIPQVPPWTMHHPKVCLDLSVLAKKDTPISCLHSKVQ